eukprot:GHVQ01040877.1.p1 GENE.GHVQ01040877.1~~GHVQ01040877.1.p1  ORF type:complete len:312 (+),score=35.97 GHVQ01040877.1:192-1127(+)
MIPRTREQRLLLQNRDKLEKHRLCERTGSYERYQYMDNPIQPTVDSPEDVLPPSYRDTEVHRFASKNDRQTQDREQMAESGYGVRGNPDWTNSASARDMIPAAAGDYCGRQKEGSMQPLSEHSCVSSTCVDYISGLSGSVDRRVAESKCPGRRDVSRQDADDRMRTVASYIPERDRFISKEELVALEQRDREKTNSRVEAFREARRFKNECRLSERERAMDAHDETQQGRMRALQQSTTAGKKNVSGAPFNIVTLAYEKSKSGEDLRHRDQLARYRDLRRKMNIASKMSGGFNPITGEQLPTQSMPTRPTR